jgi:hypothetical protein
MNSILRTRNARALALALFLGLIGHSASAQAQQRSAREIIFQTTIQWNRQRGVTRYRLQIASDEKFQNVFFDQPIKGERHVVGDLSAGFYYWRVAPVDFQPGGYSKPVRFFVSGGQVQPLKFPSRLKTSR